jgi:hypothetical protein
MKALCLASICLSFLIHLSHLYCVHRGRQETLFFMYTGMGKQKRFCFHRIK